MNGKHTTKKKRSKDGCHIYLTAHGSWSWLGMDYDGAVVEFCVTKDKARNTIEAKTRKKPYNMLDIFKCGC